MAQIVRAKETLKLSHGGFSQGTSQRMEAWSQSRHWASMRHVTARVANNEQESIQT